MIANNKLQSAILMIWDRFRRGDAKKVVIPLVIFLSAALAIVASTQLNLYLLALMIGGLGILLLTRYPSLGFLLIIVAAVSIPFEGAGGFNLAVIGVIGLAVLWILDMIVRQRRLSMAPSQTNLPIIVFLVSATLSFFLGQVPWYTSMPQAPMTAQIGGYAIFFLSAVAFLLVGNLVSELIWLKLITWLFLLYGALYTLGRLVPFASHYLRNIFQPGATTGSIFWVWLLVIPFSQALFNKDLKKIVRAALLVLVVAVLYVAIIRASGWKSGYIPPLAGLAVISALWLKKKAWIVAPIGLFLLWQISQSAVETDQYSTTTRLAAWKIVFELSAISPIFGMGFANYYWYTPLIPILGWRVNFNSHSQYIDIIAQVGIFGLLCLMWVFFAITKLGWQLKDQAQEGFEKAYVYGAIGGIAGTLVAGFFVDWILPFVYNIGLDGFRSSMLSWIFLGGLVSIEQMVRNRKSSTLENAPQQ